MIFTKTRAVAIKELRQIVRDRRTLLILLFVPAFFLLVYGYALNFDVRHIRLGVQDNDRSLLSVRAWARPPAQKGRDRRARTA